MAVAEAEVRLPTTVAALLDAIVEALSHPGVRRRFVLICIDAFGWRGGYRRGNARVSQWCDPGDPHQFPAVALLMLVAAAGHARFVDVLLAEEMRVQREQRVDERIGPMRSVRPRSRERETA